jgi:hypothetical protein
VRALISEAKGPGVRGRRARPAAERRFSVSAFMTADLYEWAREAALSQGVSLGRYLAQLVEERKAQGIGGGGTGGGQERG